MDIHRHDGPQEHVLVVTGEVGRAQAPALLAGLLAGLADGDHDVLLDARAITSFADEALPALSAARLRARSVHHHLVVVDGEGGALSRSLHRTGMLEQFPVHPGAPAASAALADDRARLAAMDTPLEATWRAVHADERTHRLEQQAREHAPTSPRSTRP